MHNGYKMPRTGPQTKPWKKVILSVASLSYRMNKKEEYQKVEYKYESGFKLILVVVNKSVGKSEEWRSIPTAQYCSCITDNILHRYKFIKLYIYGTR